MKVKHKIGPVLREFLRNYPKQFALLLGLLTVEGVSAGVAILLVIPMADYLLDPALSKPSHITRIVLEFVHFLGLPVGFSLLGGLFVAAQMLKGIMDVAVRHAILSLKYAVVRGLFSEALQKFFKARWAFFSDAARGQLLNTFNRELNTIGDAMGNLASLFAQVIQLFIYLAVPFWLNPVLTGMAISLAILFGLPFLLLNKRVYLLGKANTETANRAIGILGELLGAAKLILGYGRQQAAVKQYLHAFDEHVSVTLRSQTMTTAVPKMFQPMAMFAMVLAIGFSLKSHASVSELGAIMWSFIGALPVLATVIQGKLSLSNFLPSYEQLTALRKRAEADVEILGAHPFSRLQQGIQLQSVDFTYPGRGQTLRKLSLSIPKGNMIALVGESGSGKSTVIDLILGLQLPDAGQVLIDGSPLSDWQQNTFRDRVGYVPQEPILFHTSIRENMLWSCAHASDTEIWSALALANAEEFVRQLPGGLDTGVGDRGLRLSGGQRQRLALARALLRKPDLLILDEATSALDSDSEQLIQASIERVASETTVLVVAHRLSTIAKADMVYVLNQGQVVEQGSFRMLTDKPNGILSGMLAKQIPLEQR